MPRMVVGPRGVTVITAPSKPQGRLRNNNSLTGEGDYTDPLLSGAGEQDVGEARRDDDRACWVASACAVACVVLISVGTGFLYANLDQRLTLTTLEVFHDWGRLADVYRTGAKAYDPRYNPPSLSHGRFLWPGDVPYLMQEAYKRGFISEQQYAEWGRSFNFTSGTRYALDPGAGAFVAQELAAMSDAYERRMSDLGLPAVPGLPLALGEEPRLLFRLLAVSGCSTPDAMDHATPVGRTPGCACIAHTYLDFVRATENMTSNVTAEAREDAADAVVRCMDRRVTWQTSALDPTWSIHPLGLAVYACCILLLLCTAFLLSFNHWRLFPASWSAGRHNVLIKLALAILACGLGSIFVMRDWQANVFQIAGLVLSVSHLLFSAHEPLNYAAKGERYLDGPPSPHPLMVCFWLCVPQILPALIGAQAVSGFVRDGYGLCGVVFGGFLLGLILQRMFWVLWNTLEDTANWVVPPLLFAFFDLFVCLVFVLWVYRWSDGVYSLGHWAVVIFMTMLYPALLLGLLWIDFYRCRAHTLAACNQGFTTQGGHTLVFLVTLGMLVVLVALTVNDARLR